jgi:hypothetical protein
MVVDNSIMSTDDNNSPYLTRCKGCNMNIKKSNNNTNDEECWIYINNKFSRIITTNKIIENDQKYNKPVESLENIIAKNKDLATSYKEEHDILEDDELINKFNNKIDLIDKFISSDEINEVKDLMEVLENHNEQIIMDIYIKEFIVMTSNNIKEKYKYIIYVKCTDNNEEYIFKFTVRNKEISKQKALLDGLIILLIILHGKERLTINIDENIVKLINKYILEKSDRKKMKFQWYIELKFIQEWIIDNENLTFEGVKLIDEELIKKIDTEYEKVISVELQGIELGSFVLRWKHEYIWGDIETGSKNMI